MLLRVQAGDAAKATGMVRLPTLKVKTSRTKALSFKVFRTRSQIAQVKTSGIERGLRGSLDNRE